MASLQEMTPPTLDHIVQRCMSKDPEDRWQTALDMMKELQWVTEAGTLVVPPPSVTSPGLWKRAIPWSIAVVTALIAVITVWILTTPAPRPHTEFLITPPADASLSMAGNHLAISPDGRRIVYRAGEVTAGKLYLRSLDDVVARAILPALRGRSLSRSSRPMGSGWRSLPPVAN